jgi:hypothetical protein
MHVGKGVSFDFVGEKDLLEALKADEIGVSGHESVIRGQLSVVTSV